MCEERNDSSARTRRSRLLRHDRVDDATPDASSDANRRTGLSPLFAHSCFLGMLFIAGVLCAACTAADDANRAPSGSEYGDETARSAGPDGDGPAAAPSGDRAAAHPILEIITRDADGRPLPDSDVALFSGMGTLFNLGERRTDASGTVPFRDRRRRHDRIQRRPHPLRSATRRRTTRSPRRPTALVTTTCSGGATSRSIRASRIESSSSRTTAAASSSRARQRASRSHGDNAPIAHNATRCGDAYSRGGSIPAARSAPSIASRYACIE